MSTKERSVVFLKPDVLEKNIIGKVIAEIEHNNIRIVGMKMLSLNKNQAEQFYAVHKGKPFFESLVTYVTRGPIVAMVLEGDGIIAKARQVMGATNPTQADKATLRGMFGESLDANVIHGSDSPEAAATEIPFFFSKLDLVKR